MFKLMGRINPKNSGKDISVMSKKHEPKLNFIKILVLAMLMFAPFITQAQTVYFEDNFDTYTAGQRLVGQATGTPWRTWTNTTPNGENPYVRDDRSQTAPNSVKIENNNDLYFPFENFKSGKYSIEFDYNVVSTGNGGYVNVQHKSTAQGAPGGEYAFNVWFRNNGTGYLSVNSINYDFSYGAANTWFHVYMEIDLNNDLASLLINETTVHTWQFSLQAINGAHPHNNQLGGVNFFAGCPSSSQSDRGTYYIDNFKVINILDSNIGVFEVEPNEKFVVKLDAGQTETKTFTVSNTGSGPVNYKVVPTYYPEEPSTVPGTTTEIKYYNEGDGRFNADYMNTNEYILAIGLPASYLENHIGKKLSKVSIALLLGQYATSAKLQIYKMNFETMEYIPSDNIIYEQSFTPVSSATDSYSITDITLTNPVLIDGGDLWVAIKITQPMPNAQHNNIPCYMVEKTVNPNPNSNFVKTGVSWNRILTSGNYVMSAEISGRQVISGKWITAEPSKGVLAPGENANVTVTFGRQNITGTIPVFHGNVNFVSDDFNHAHIPVDFIVNRYAPDFITNKLPDGKLGDSYNAKIEAKGAPSDITFMPENSQLPNGLTLSPEGVISGTPLSDGTFSFTVKATNTAGSNSQDFTIKIWETDLPPVIKTETLPKGIVGENYEATLEAESYSTVTWTLESGTLPLGLTLLKEGVISGKPIEDGTFSITVKATNVVSSTIATLQINISKSTNVPPVIITKTLPDGTVGEYYEAILEAESYSTVTWTIESGTLPDGLTLSKEGVISGIPAKDDTFLIIVKATNAVSYDLAIFNINISKSGIFKNFISEIKVYIQNGMLNISGLALGEKLSIYNISGILIYEKIAQSAIEKINVTGFSSGIYAIKSGNNTINVVF